MKNMIIANIIIIITIINWFHFLLKDMLCDFLIILLFTYHQLVEYKVNFNYTHHITVIRNVVVRMLMVFVIVIISRFCTVLPIGCISVMFVVVPINRRVIICTITSIISVRRWVVKSSCDNLCDSWTLLYRLSNTLNLDHLVVRT